VAGAAVAAVTGLLSSGPPVPAHQDPSLPRPTHPSAGFVLTTLRAPDPEGGPAWGLGTYAAGPSGRVTCAVIGRVQAGRLGVVGRDGVFHDDGRFHELSPSAQTAEICGGRAPDGTLLLISGGPPIPASGYTGAPGTEIGGCRERVNLDGPTVSPQTRKRLRHVPECAKASLRRVISGFAGKHAATATLTAGGRSQTLRLDPKQNGPYLFVTRATGPSPKLTLTDGDGNRCHPFARPPSPCRGLIR
jgi:hypothetical protein